MFDEQAWTRDVCVSKWTESSYGMQILGNNECFEPYTSNIYVRRVLSGEFTVVNQHLLMDLTRLGLWSSDLKNELVAANGSIQVQKVICMPSLLRDCARIACAA